MAHPTQTEMILNHLQNIGPITAKDAFVMYGCQRLSAKIYDIKKLGFDVRTIMKSGRNRYGNNVNFAEYKLIGGNAENDTWNVEGT